MKTELKRFCFDLESRLTPFTREVRRVLRDLESDKSAFDLGPVMEDFSKELANIDSLVQKLRQEEAYLIIFGPLKSGKSTLMNAIAGAYVSEVSSLPAYPCLVHVRHGRKGSYRLLRYNGEVQEFVSNNGLQEEVREAHISLAGALVATERNGDTFEPERHFPEAIRDIDIALPATRLGVSSPVLVDTPGLYAKMRFGYDRLTKEFRDHASCAIFVVKADNLFLEQVFTEFNDLLGFFSRIYLVVNIDREKKDLVESGDLVPSLESRDPEKIIAAFESLSMNVQIRQAFEENRLRIYPIDLQDVATQVLRGGSDSPRVESIVSDLNAMMDQAPVAEEASEAGEAAEMDKPESTTVAEAQTLASEAPPEESVESDPTEAASVAGPEHRDANHGEGSETESATEESSTSQQQAGRAEEDLAESAESEPEMRSVAYAAPHEPEARLQDPVAVEPDEPEYEVPEVPLERDIGMRRFNKFIRDLEDYLNGSEYLDEFVIDHLRRAERVVHRYESLFNLESVRSFMRMAIEVEMNIHRSQQRIEAAEKLEEMDWEAVFKPVHESAQAIATADQGNFRERIQTVISEQLEAWLQNDESLWELLGRSLPEALGAEGKAITRSTRRRVLAMLHVGEGEGIPVSEQQQQSLKTLGIDLDGYVNEARKQVEEGVEESEELQVRVDLSQIPVKRSVADRCFLRSPGRVAKSLFGSNEKPDRPVSAEAKEERLDGEARERLREVLVNAVREGFVEAPAIGILERLEEFLQTLQIQVSEAVSKAHEEAVSEHNSLRGKRGELAAHSQALSEIRHYVRKLGQSLGEVRAGHTIAHT